MENRKYGCSSPWLPGGRYANLAANMPGYRGQILVFLDISDPRNPKEVSRFWLPGQKDGEPPPSAPTSFHGPAIIDGDKAYLGYGPAVVTLDISDIAHPKQIGRLDFVPPFKPGITVHDVHYIPGRSLLFAHSEGSGGDTANQAPTCSGPMDLVAMVDIKDLSQAAVDLRFPDARASARVRLTLTSAIREAGSDPTIRISNTICQTWRSRPT